MTQRDGPEISDEPTKHPQFDTLHHEGYFSISVGDLYYRQFGSGSNVLVGLHGGPGASHDYLAPLESFAGAEWTVYLYDQYGCGRSDHPPERVFDHYTIQKYCDRLDEVREAIGERRLHLYGHSWGGWLALQYALSYSDRVASLVLADTSADISRAATTMREAVYKTLTEGEREEFEELVRTRSFDDDTFREYHERTANAHINRSDAEPFRWGPDFNETIYGVMWGPSEFVLAETARLRDWSVADRLGEIECPTLVLNGEHDEIAPSLGEEIAEGIPTAQFVEIADASHLPLWEQPEAHVEVVNRFLNSVTEESRVSSGE